MISHNCVRRNGPIKLYHDEYTHKPQKLDLSSGGNHHHVYERFDEPDHKICLSSFFHLSLQNDDLVLSSMLSILYGRILRLNNLQISLLDFHTIWLPDLDILCASSKSLRNLTIKSLFSFSYDTLFFMNFWKPNGFLVYDSFKHQFRFGPSMTQHYPV